MDYDLLEADAKNYDQAIRVVRRVDGEPLVTITPKEIQEVFGLEPLIDYHLPINLQELEKEYMSKRDVIRWGALRAHIGRIRNFPIIIVASREPFKKEYFTS